MSLQKPRKAPEYDQEDVYPERVGETSDPHQMDPSEFGQWSPESSFGRTTAPPTNLEKDYGPYNPPAATPEEMFKAEQELIKTRMPDLPTIITMKEEEQEAQREMDELMQMRENPVGQTQPARLPPESLPPGSPPTVPPHKPMPPQVPGAVTYPNQGAQSTAPMNPFANYGQQQSKPESGLPWKPPGSGGGGFGKSFKTWVTLHDGRHIDIGEDAGKAGDKLSKQGYNLQTAQRNPNTGNGSQVWNHGASNHNVYMTHDQGGKILEAHDSSTGKSFRKKMFTSNSLPTSDKGEAPPPPVIDHDCLSVHGYKSHDDWQVEQYAKDALNESKT